MNDDVALLRRYAKDRDEAAFADLVQRYLPLVYSAALRQLAGATHRAEEVAQSVFTDLARKAAPLSRRDDLVGWLYTSTHFAAAKLKRTEQRRQQREQEAHTMHEILSGSAEVEWERLRPVLDDVMHELDEHDRDVILQRFFRGRRLAEVGEKLGVTEDAARMRVDRALEKLRALLGRRGVNSTGTALAVALADQAVIAAPAGLTTVVCDTAFAHAAGAGSGAAGWMAFMSTTKFTAIVAVALVILTVGVATHGVLARREAAASLAAAIQADAARSADLRELEQRAQVAEGNRNQLQQKVDDAAQAASVAATIASPSDPAANGRDFLAQHPEAARLVADYMQAFLGRNFQTLFKALALSPQQTDQFLKIWVQANGGVRWNTAAQAPFAEFGVGEKISPEERESQLHAVLGDLGYERFRDFQRTGAARDFVEQVARNVNFSNAPLTATQAERLTEIIARHSSDYQAGRNASWTNFEWDAALQEARGVLGEKQLAAFGGVRDQIQFSRALNLAVGEAMKAAKQAAGVPPNF